MTVHFDHVGDCTFPTSGSCTCGATLPLVRDVWMDDPYHPFVRGTFYSNPGNYRRVGPRGGLRRMSHDNPEDRESLMSCAQVVARGTGSFLALCRRPRFKHLGYEENIR